MWNMIIQHGLGHIFRQIRPGLWQLNFRLPASTNCWLYQESDGLSLIDAANSWNACTIGKLIKSMSLPLRRIIVTHAHPDHAGSAEELSREFNAPVFVHENEKDFLTGVSSMADLEGDFFCKTLLKAGRSLGILSAPVVRNLVSIADCQMLGSLQVIHTPGHTPGSISLWSEKHEAIFCGDNIVASFNKLRWGLACFTLDAETQKASIKSYAALKNASLLLSGHGAAYYSKELSREFENLTE